MGVYSNWKLTFDPATAAIVVLAYDAKMANEMKISQSNGTEVVNAPDSPDPLILALGNSAVTLRLEFYDDKSTDKAARQEILDGLISYAALGVKPLKIEVAGYTDRYWTFAQCRIAEHERGRVVPSGGARLTKVYTLTCAGLSKTGP